jgi:1-pyrroline-5-carboxylate dehydrogenase
MFPFQRPQNLAPLAYEPGSKARESIKAQLDQMASEKIEIPCIIGGKEVRTGTLKKVVMPHDHQHVLAEFHMAGPQEIALAAQSALKAKNQWESMEWTERAAIFLKAADLIAGPYRSTINAATMLGQSKSVYQAELDSACELADFLRLNVFFYQEIMSVQPQSVEGIWNRTEYRSLEGFVFAITPFNFTAIAGNLPTAPALMGNTVVWKPADTQMYSAYYTMKILLEAGLPDGVINFIGADGPMAGDLLLSMQDLAGVHFTGSTGTFRHIWSTVGEKIGKYRTYPRLVGETGGKGFVFAHPSADVDSLSVALVRGAFEYQGQKCSAASRAYIPSNLWKSLESKLLASISQIKMGDVRDFRNFVNAVIDEKAFLKVSRYLEHAKNTSEARILCGGTGNRSVGYFIDPTVIVANQPHYPSMVQEIFGPVLTVFVYPEGQLQETIQICESTSEYALTGAIFARDRIAVQQLTQQLRHAAGNFYINDKPTGAVVGQQPFGGGRASGTNDKAGSSLNLQRWLSPRTIKELFVAPPGFAYPFMAEK